MKKKYEKPGFYPIELEANVMAENCYYTNNYCWGVCPIMLDGLGTVFGDDCDISPDDLGLDPNSEICYDIAGANINTFGS